MRLYLIRHGQTDCNAKGLLQGRADVPLNEKGRELALLTGKALEEIPFDLIITSPLNRAVETAKLVASFSANRRQVEIPIVEEERIIEIDWGEWEGRCIRPENIEVPEEFYLFYEDAFAYPGAPGGESIEDVCRRTGDFFQELIHNPQYQEKTILISAHGCSTRGILHQVYGDQGDFWHGRIPYNLAVNVVEVKNGQAVLLEEDRIFYPYTPGKNYFTKKTQNP